MTKRSAINSGMAQNPSNARTAIFALTRKGAELADVISAQIPGSTCLCNYRCALPGMTLFAHISEVFPSAWRECDSIICIMGCGIAVRMVSPLIEHKTVDPAVVVVDQEGRFAVSLLSGHIGGANELARKVAAITGGQAVITTASDLQDKPAIDLAAKKAGLRIENSGILSRIQASILDEELIWIFDPDGLLLKHLPANHGLREIDSGNDSGAFRDGLGIWVSEQLSPRGIECLKLRPANLVVGIGCNRGTTSTRSSNLSAKSLRKTGSVLFQSEIL